jgi:hypothetical protein
MGRMRGSEPYRKYIKYILFLTTAAFLVWLTPHTLVMRAAELKAIGGQQHPVIGNFGVMSAKNGAVNTMLMTTIISFILYQRCNKIITVSWAAWGNAVMIAMFAVAMVNNWWLAIMGYSIPANVRVGLSVPQVMGTLTCLSSASPNSAIMRGRAHRSGGVGQNLGTIAIWPLRVAVSFHMVDGPDGVHPIGRCDCSGTRWKC